jgi:hypothetical protein
MKNRKGKGRTWAAAALALAISALSLPCQKRTGIKGLDLSVSFSRRNLTDDLYVDVTLKWRLSRDFQGFSENRPVFLRIDHEGEALVEDVFTPAPPLPEWGPGGEHEIVRRVYIPRFIDEYDPGFRGVEPAVLTVGLGGDTRGGEEIETVVLTRRLRISPASMTPAILYVDGWHGTGKGPGEDSPEGRWTGKAARCLIDNPKRNALLVIRGEADLEAAPGQEITVRLGGRVLERFVPAEAEFEKSYQISEEALGKGKDFFLEISVDRTFLPSDAGPEAKGEAERGVFVSFLYFR